MRMNDLADQLAQLGVALQGETRVEDLRLMAEACLRRKQFSKQKWTQMAVAIRATLDAWHGPFKESSQ